MDKSLRQQEIALPDVPELDDPKVTRYLRQLRDILVQNSLLHQQKVEQFDDDTLVDEATPSVISYYKHSYWVTGGTTTITDFDQGYHGQVITILAEHSVTITHSTHIILSGGVNLDMTSGDSLTLILKNNDKW